MEQAVNHRLPHTRLDGRSLLVVRSIWVAFVVLMLGLLIITSPYRFAEVGTVCVVGDCPVAQLTPEGERVLQQVGLSAQFFALYVTIVEIILAIVFLAVGVLIFWRRSDDWMAILVSMTLMLAGVSLFPLLDALAAVHPAWSVIAEYARTLTIGALLWICCLFPDGHFVPRWTRLWAILLAAWVLVSPLTPIAYASFPWMLMFVVWGSVGVYAQIHRYRRASGPVERQQTKWVVFGFTAGFLGFLTGALLPHLIIPSVISPLNLPLTDAPNLVYRLIIFPVIAFGSVSLVPLTIGLAVLRYRLWDTDPLFNRTLIYAVLTATLVALYWASVGVLQSVFRVFTGQGSDLAIIISTLVIAALFQPLRRRIQRIIDRQFYRRKYDAASVLAAFGASARDEVDLGQLGGRLVDAVEEAMQPAHVSLWLRKGARPPR